MLRSLVDLTVFLDLLILLLIALMLNLDAARLGGIQHAGLGGEAPGFESAPRSQNMGMMVALIALAMGAMVPTSIATP